MPITNLRQDLPQQQMLDVQQVRPMNVGILRADTSAETSRLGQVQAVGGMLGAWLEQKIKKDQSAAQLSGAAAAQRFAAAKDTGLLASNEYAKAAQVQLAAGQEDAEYPDAYAQGFAALATQKITQHYGTAIQTRAQKERTKPFQEWQAPDVFAKGLEDEANKVRDEYTSLPGISAQQLLAVDATIASQIEQTSAQYGKAYTERLMVERQATVLSTAKDSAEQLFSAVALPIVRTDRQAQMDTAVQNMARLLQLPDPVLAPDVRDKLLVEAFQSKMQDLQNGPYSPQQKRLIIEAVHVAAGKGAPKAVREFVNTLQDDLRKYNAIVVGDDLAQAADAVQAGTVIAWGQDSPFVGVDPGDVQSIEQRVHDMHATGALSTEGLSTALTHLRAYKVSRYKQNYTPMKAVVTVPGEDGAPRADLSMQVWNAKLNAGDASATQDLVQFAAATGQTPTVVLATIYPAVSPEVRHKAQDIMRDITEDYAKTALQQLAAGAVDYGVVQGQLDAISRTGASPGPQTVLLQRLMARTRETVLGSSKDTDIAGRSAELNAKLVEFYKADRVPTPGVEVVQKAREIIQAGTGIAIGPESNRLLSAMGQYQEATRKVFQTDADFADGLSNVWYPTSPKEQAGIFIPVALASQPAMPHIKANAVALALTFAARTRAGTGMTDAQATELQTSIRKGYGGLLLPDGTMQQVYFRATPGEFGDVQLQYRVQGTDSWESYNATATAEDTRAALHMVQLERLASRSLSINNVPVRAPELMYLPKNVPGLTIPKDRLEQSRLFSTLEGAAGTGDLARTLADSTLKGFTRPESLNPQHRLVSDQLRAAGVLAYTYTKNKAQAQAAVRAVLKLATAERPTPDDLQRAGRAIVGPKADKEDHRYAMKWLQQSLQDFGSALKDIKVYTDAPKPNKRK